jgi:hypothetical protein
MSGVVNVAVDNIRLHNTLATIRRQASAFLPFFSSLTDWSLCLFIIPLDWVDSTILTTNTHSWPVREIQTLTFHLTQTQNEHPRHLFADRW